MVKDLEELTKKNRIPIFKCRVGSHLYGFNTSESDEDYIGVFLPSKEDILGISNIDEIDLSTNKSNSKNTNEDQDFKMYSFPKFIDLLYKNSPGQIEMLFAPKNQIEYIHPVMEELMANYDKIVSQKVFNSFFGYGIGQEKKLDVKSGRYFGLMSAKEHLEKFYELDLRFKGDKLIGSKVVASLNQMTFKFDPKRENYFDSSMTFNFVYGKIEEEIEKYGHRVHVDSFKELHYDVKFAYHMIRILSECLELLTFGKIEFPLATSKQFIHDIRKGNISFYELKRETKELKEKVEIEKERTSIRAKADYKWINNFQIDILSKVVRGEV
jgi:hypothetical protein